MPAYGLLLSYVCEHVCMLRTVCACMYICTCIRMYCMHIQDGVCSPEDIDTAVTEGLGLRYAFVGPLETMHLNANGVFLLLAYVDYKHMHIRIHTL